MILLKTNYMHRQIYVHIKSKICPNLYAMIP